MEDDATQGVDTTMPSDQAATPPASTGLQARSILLSMDDRQAARDVMAMFGATNETDAIRVALRVARQNNTANSAQRITELESTLADYRAMVSDLRATVTDLRTTLTGLQSSVVSPSSVVSQGNGTSLQSGQPDFSQSGYDPSLLQQFIDLLVDDAHKLFALDLLSSKAPVNSPRVSSRRGLKNEAQIRQAVKALIGGKGTDGKRRNLLTYLQSQGILPKK